MIGYSLFTKGRQLLPLLICQFCSSFGDNFLRTLFVLLVTFGAVVSAFKGAVMVNLAMALFMLPFCFVATTSSQMVNKFNKIDVLHSLQILSIFVAAISIYGLTYGNYPVLLGAIFFSGIHAVFFTEVRQNIIFSVLKRTPVTDEENQIRIVTLLGSLLGMIAAGLIFSATSTDSELPALVIIITSIISLTSAYMLRPAEQRRKKLPTQLNLLSDIGPCLRKASKNKNTFLSLQGISWFWLLGGIFISQLPVLTRDSFHCGPSVLVFLLTTLSVGIGVGITLCHRILKNQLGMHFVPTSMLIISFFVFDICYLIVNNHFTGSLNSIGTFLSYRDGLNISIDVFMLAATGGMYLMPLYKYLQLSSARPYRTQLRAANNIMNAFFIGVSSVLTIIMLYLGVKTTYVIILLGTANFLTAVYICKVLPNTVVKNVLRTLLIMTYRVEVVGIENLNKAGNRVMIISNHNSSLDPLVISAFLPGKIYFAMDDYLLKSSWLVPFMKILRAKPINNSHPMSVKTLIDKLKAGKQVVIFPEGRMTVTGSLMKIYDAPGMIADKADATLLPIRIEGTQYSIFSRMQGKLKLKLFPKIKMTILPPRKIVVEESELSSSRERRHVIGDKLYDIMSETMFQKTQAHQTLFEAALNARKQFGGTYIIASDVNKVNLSYNNLMIGAFALGKQISLKTALGEKVGILLPNMCGTLVTFFAMMAYGRTPAMLNFSTGIKNMLSCCNAAVITTIYTSRLFIEAADLQSVIKALSDNGITVRYLEDERKKISIISRLAAIYKAFHARKYYWNEAISQGITPESPAVVLFTSGSEGTPKGVVLSHFNIISNMKQAISRIDLSSSDRLFNALPMFHSFGLTAGIIMPLLCGISTFLYPSPLHYRVVPEMIYAHNSTIFFGTDTFLAGYAKYAHPYDFFSVRYVFAGAEKLRSETRRIWIEKFGIRIFEAYGATEASPIIAANTPMHCKHGTVGRMLPNIEWKIEKVPGIAEGGKLILRGPNVMLGYLKADNPGVIQPPAHEIDNELQQGWYDTGDVITIDEEQYITISGRMKRFAKIGGEMVSLVAIEEAVNQLWPDFANAAVSVSDTKKNEVILLLTENPNATRDALIEFFHKQGYADLFRPKKLMIVEQIPVLSTGKVDYVSLQNLAETSNA